MRAHRSGSLLLSLVGLLVVSGPAAATNLSGAILYSSDGTGAATGRQIWNTLGGDFFFNLYLANTPNPPPGFLNSGDGAGASINLSLTLGATTFHVFGAPGSDPTGSVSLGLFFNGNNSTPGLAGVNGTNGPGTGVVAASTSNSVSLSFGSATNPQSLSFVDGATTVKLTSFAWNSGR